MEASPEIQENSTPGQECLDREDERVSEDSQNIEETWTLIDQEQEFESAVSGLNGMELGRSLLGDELTDGNGNCEDASSVESGGLISQRQLDSIQLGESLDSTYSSNMSHSHSTVKSTYMQDVESEQLEYPPTIHHSELLEEIATMTAEMTVIKGEYFALQNEKQQVQAEDAQMASILKMQISQLEEELSVQKAVADRERSACADEVAKVAAMQKALLSFRDDICTMEVSIQSERESFASDRIAFMAEKSHMEEEIENLRKERQYWQAKCMETVEGSRDNEEILMASINSIKRRVLNLGNEARHCRLMEEEGGRWVSYPDAANSRSLEDSLDSLKNGNVHAGVEEIEAALCELENEFIPIVSRWHSQAASFNERGVPSQAPKISLSSFEENDLALFFPTPRGDYLAFNAGAPHHYLSAESKALIGQDKHFRKIYVLGKIVLKEEKIATAEDSPYRLAPGVKYYEVSVTTISNQVNSDGGVVRVVEE